MAIDLSDRRGRELVSGLGTRNPNIAELLCAKLPSIAAKVQKEIYLAV